MNVADASVYRLIMQPGRATQYLPALRPPPLPRGVVRRRHGRARVPASWAFCAALAALFAVIGGSAGLAGLGALAVVVGTKLTLGAG